MHKVRVHFAGQIIQYECSQPPAYSHDRAKYFAIVKTGGGDRLVTSFSRRGPYNFGPDVAVDEKGIIRSLGSQSCQKWMV